MSREGIVITQTPFRLSLFGGGTDFPAYFNAYGGAVLTTAIDKYLYVTVNSLKRFYEKRIRLSHFKLEIVDQLEQLDHPLVKTILQHHPFFGQDTFLDMHSYADFPAACGMGSSSAFAIGFLSALYALNGAYKTAEEIATEAIYIEREKLKDIGGWQDQIASAFGGFNLVSFKDNRFFVEPIALPPERMKTLESACLLFFTGGTRSSSLMQQHMLQLDDQTKLNHLHQIKNSVFDALHILRNEKDELGMLYQLGELMKEAWQAKRSLSNTISNPDIDEMYEVALQAGALGGKLCGAGGQGFLLLLVPVERQARVLAALKDRQYLSLKFDDFGSRIIYSHLRS
jgi:D-glycero-alpha-D-manno-heptose-7-phosphate kinase